jgi:hypothetical protein
MLAFCIQCSVTTLMEPCFKIKHVSTNAKIHVVAYFKQTVFGLGYITDTFQLHCFSSVESLNNCRVVTHIQTLFNLTLLH